MGNLVFQATLGGQVSLVGPNTASTFNINVPAVAGNMVTTGDTGTVTNTMLASSAYTAPGTIGSGTANTGAFTTLTASSTITGTKLIPTGTSVTGNGMYLPSANTLGFSTNGTNAVTIDTSQNVGINGAPNTWSLGKALEFGTAGAALWWATSTNVIVTSNMYYNGAYKYAATAPASFYQQYNGAHNWQIAASGTAGTTATFTQAMTLDASGRLLVGATSAADTTLRTQSGSSSTDGRVEAWFSTSNNGSYGVLQLGAANTSTTTECSIHFVSGATALGQSPTSANGTQYDWGLGLSPYGVGGNVFAVACTANGGANVKLNYNSTAWLAGSDERIKDITGNIENALNIISPWRTVFYRLKNDESKHVKAGLIAQDVLQTLPEVVDIPEKEYNDKGELVPLSIAYTEIIPVLVKAIQEQQALITQLQADVAALKG
jgi:hypothetical protein